MRGSGCRVRCASAMLRRMHRLRDLFRPPSLGIAVVGSTVAGLVVIGIGIASLFANHAAFSAGIGAVLVGYGLLVLLGPFFGIRRSPIARALIVAPALLHTATAVSLLQGGDVPQTVGAAIALVVFLVTIVAAVLPATRAALSGAGQPREQA